MRTLAIVPFEYSKSLQFVASGITGYLIREFGKDSNFKVISESSSSTVKPGFNIMEAGKKLHASYIISGKLNEGHEIEILLKIHETYSSTTLWEGKVDVPKTRIVELGPLCFNKLNYRLTSSVMSRGFKGSQSRPINQHAWQKFLEGKYFFNRWSEETSRQAEILFQEVNKLEPDFAPAYNWLAKVYIFQAGRGYALPQQVYPKAEKLIDRSLEINADSGEAWIYKGLIEFFFHLNWEACYMNIQRGLKDYVDASEAYQQLSLFWYGMKSYEESLSALNAALEFDPLSTGILNMVGDVHISQGNFREAEKVFRSILKLYPDDGASLENLGFLYTLDNQKEKALAFLNRYRKKLAYNESVSPRLAYAYGKYGSDEEVQEILSTYERLEKEHPEKLFHNPLSNLYAGLGEWDRVRELITTAWRKRSGILYIVADPVLEPIRETAWYKALTTEIQFPRLAEERHYVSITTDLKEPVKIDSSALLYLKAEDQYVELYLNRNFRLEKKLVRQRLENLLEQLPSQFIRTHRSYAINTQLDLNLSGNSRGMSLHSGKYGFEVPVSRSRIQEVKAALVS